jgi:hypothetical protein
LEGKPGVEEPEFVGFALYFVTDPSVSGGKIEGIDIKKLILLLRDFIAQIVLVLNLENEIRDLHTSPKEGFLERFLKFASQAETRFSRQDLSKKRETFTLHIFAVCFMPQRIES